MGVYRVLCDWDGNGTLGDASEDITADVMEIETFRGRDYASQLTGRSVAGSLIVTLENSAGTYNSFNSGSPIYGNIVPGRKVQVQTYDSFPYTFPFVFAATPLWTGYLLRIEPQPSVHGAHRAILRAIGSLGRIAQRDVDVAMATTILTSDAIDDVLDAAAWGAGDRDIQTGKTTMTRWWAEGKALGALQDIEDTENGFLWEKADGKIAFSDRHFRLTQSRCTTSQTTWSDAAGATLAYSRIDQQDPLKEIYNIVAATVQTYTVGSLAVLWTLTESGASSPAIAPGETRVWWAQYPNPDSASAAIAVDAWTTPVATTDYTANSQADGGGTDMTASMAVSVSKFAAAMKISITNNGAVNAYITLLQARGTPVSRGDPVTVKAEDSTSKTADGERTWPVPAKFIPDTDEAVDATGHLLSIYKDPVPVLAVTFAGNRNQSTISQVESRDINDRVTITATNDSDLGISEDFWIESISHRIDQHRHHWTTFTLSPCNAFGGFWILGISELGVSTRCAY